MYTATNWLRAVLAALVLAVFAPAADATRTTATRLAETAAEDRPAAGSPEFGLLIILGAVGFLILVAWLFARVGDDSSPSDQSMI